MPRPKQKRHPSPSDLDSEKCLVRNPNVDIFIISELSNAAPGYVKSHYLLPENPNDHVVDPFTPWYKPVPLEVACTQLHIPRSIFNSRIRLYFHTYDANFEKVYYPIVVGRVLHESMLRLQKSDPTGGFDTLRKVVAHHEGQIKASRNAKSQTRAKAVTTRDELNLTLQSLSESREELAKCYRIIAVLRKKLKPAAQSKLDSIMAEQGLSLPDQHTQPQTGQDDHAQAA